MKSALSSALTYNPAAVLKAVSGSKILTLSDVCTAPIDVKDSEAKANFQQRASRTLLTIKNSDMAGPRDSCLAELKNCRSNYQVNENSHQVNEKRYQQPANQDSRTNRMIAG